jgi:uncharacterized protein (DUF2252 family)
MQRISTLTQRILAQNAGRDFDRLTLKLAHLREDAFAFFRGTNPLFLGFLPRRHFLFRAPSILICGDLHLENFGAFKGDNRLCYFDLNDFDEACLAPFTIDIVRFVTGVKVAARGWGLGARHTRLLVEEFLDSYSRGIRDGKPRWMERSLATGVFRALLRRAIERPRAELLDRFTKVKGGRRRMRIDGVRALALEPGDLKRLRSFLAQSDLPQPNPRFFELLDAARRIAGCGSLGLERYMMLVRGRGSPDGHFVLDLKLAAPSAVIEWLGLKQPAWASEAHRVTDVQSIMQAISPAMLRAVQFEDRPFVLKELQPSIDRLDLDRWRGKKLERFTQAVAGMGRVTAWAQLRSCGRRGAAAVEELQAYVAGKRWAPATVRVAEAAAQRLHAAWQTYAKDYDSGAVTAAIAPTAAAAG